MNTLEALYFPGTEIYSGSQFPTFLFFQKIHILQPVETLETADNTADIFKTTGLCQVHTPCPLGENRDRFLRLIRDIRERKDDYAAQLSSLTVASLSAKKPSIDDTHQGIVTSLLGHHAVATASEEQADVSLWQARLVLKIGEILDQEEEEVAMQMALLDDQEENLFKTLQGEMDDEEDSLFSELQQVKEKMTQPSVNSVKNRLAAWSKLYLNARESESTIWLTHMEEAAEILLEKYENLTGSPAPIIAELELPANIGWSKEEAVRQIQVFQNTNRELLAEIMQAISDRSIETLKALSERWSRTLESAFPKERTGRTALVVYHLGDVGCANVLQKSVNSGTMLAIVRWLA